MSITHTTVKRINWTPTHLLKHFVGEVGVYVHARLHTPPCKKPTARTINPNSLSGCVCRCVSQRSHVMYVRLAASSQFQVGLITKVIPPEQQLRNGRRW